MSSIQLLRVLVNERLSAAAEEIFEAVKKTIAGYEEEIVQSKREIHRQQRMLQRVSKPERNIDKLQDQPQLALSVWDEDFSPDQQQEEGQCEPDWATALEEEPPQTEENLEDPASAHEKTQPQEPEEDNNTISIIFTSPYVKNIPNLLQSSRHSQTEAVEGDPLPGTSAELDQMKMEDDDVAPSSCPPTDGSDEEWRVRDGSPSDDSDVDDEWKKQMNPGRPTAPKLHQTKKNKSRICCRLCGKAFHATVSLVNHIEVHPKDVCGVCGERFDTEESFKVHVKTHVKAETCSVCGKCFGASSSLETHMRIHTGEKPFNCSDCGKAFNCRHNLMRHIRIHTGEKPYPCSVCGRRFNDYTTLKRHLQLHQKRKNLNPSADEEREEGDDDDGGGEAKVKTPPPKKQPSHCQVCGKTFHSMVSLVNHAKGHATDMCCVCGMNFDSQENLKVHLRTHKNGKVCEVCGKCFDSDGSLEIHMRVHTGEKPFLCSQCGKSFNCRHNMMRHIRTHTGEKPYACNACGKCFNDHTSLKHHRSTHTGEKPHRCEVCGKSFNRRAYLKLHMKSHTAEK